MHQFFHWLLVDPEDGVIQYAQDEKEEQVKEAILSVADLYSRVMKGQEVTNEQWSAASGAARAARVTVLPSAAWDAALSASEAASDAARAAAWAARDAAWSAARAAREAARAAWDARDAASEAAIKRQKQKLLELLAGESVLHERGYGQVRK